LTKKKSTTPKKVCLKCQKEKNTTEYFLSNSDLHTDKKYPVCKVCLKENLDINDINSVQDTLMQMNRPFLMDVWIGSVDEGKRTGREIFGMYLKNCQLNFKNLTWKNSVFINETKSEMHEQFNIIEEDIKPTADLIKKWGKFEPEDYFKLEDFYTKMMISNKIETPQEETYLKKLAVISLKMDKELEAGNYGQVKQLGDLFSKYMADSKFRAMDQTDASKTGGLRTFSQIYAEVEKDEFIPPWEEYRKVKGLEQDIVDKTIMHILNYTLKLNKAPQLIEPPEDTPKIEED
jgi:hypothetical protein